MPQRTCVACRQKFDKRRLTRIVRAESGVFVDPTGKRNGRGAYVCDRPSCWDKMLRETRLLSQALMAEISDEDIAAIALHKPVGEEEGAASPSAASLPKVAAENSFVEVAVAPGGGESPAGNCG